MNEQTKAALREQLHPLGDSQDNGCFADFEFLTETLKNVRIVGLGEGSHGTREHFQFKHRLIRFLVERMGFRTFVIESALDACDVVNEYVLYGRGDRAKALAGLHYWVWDTEEVAAMIDWMREHNRTCRKNEECSFLGFDVQSCDVACSRLLDRLVPLAGDDADKVRKVIEKAGKATKKAPCEDLPDIEWLLGWVIGHEVMLTRASDPNSYRMFVRYVRHIHCNITLMSVDWRGEQGRYRGVTCRDKLMAKNVHLLINELPPDSKVILWAHNLHIASGCLGWKTIGTWLREDYGSLYYPIGFMMRKGQFQSRLYDRVKNITGALQVFDVPSIGQNLWEYDVSQLAHGNFFIDLRKAIANNSDIAKWASQEKDFLMPDESWDPVHGQHHYEPSGVLKDVFEGILYTEDTNSAHPNPTGHRDGIISEKV